MIDRHDFDEWWAREEARNYAGIGADYKRWAERGFLAAAQLMAQSLKSQKKRAALLREVPKREPGLSPSMSGYIRTLPAKHEANMPAAELAALLVKRAQSK